MLKTTAFYQQFKKYLKGSVKSQIHNCSDDEISEKKRNENITRKYNTVPLKNHNTCCL